MINVQNVNQWARMQNFSIEVDKRGFLYVAMYGAISSSTIIEIIRRQWQSGIGHAFWDLCEATTENLTAQDLRDVVAFVENNRPRDFRPGALGFLVSGDAAFGVMRMVQRFNYGLGIDIHVSRSRQELERWIVEDHPSPDRMPPFSPGTDH